jgi:hypothetical protein
MKSIASMQEKTRALIKSAWVTLGMPFDLPAIDEKVEGIIDIEGLIMATLLLMEEDRMVTDLPAWLDRFSSLINHQKLKTMVNAISQEHRTLILDNVKKAPFGSAPKSIRNIFNLKEPESKAVSETVHMRGRKLNTIPNVAGASIMIHNRLLYGTTFRADLITLSHIKGFSIKGTRLAKLLCTNDSTISRLLKDLRDSSFLDHDNERTEPLESFPGMFISTQSVWNLCEMIDAFKFSFEELRRGAFENLDLKHDGFGRKIVAELT